MKKNIITMIAPQRILRKIFLSLSVGFFLFVNLCGPVVEEDTFSVSTEDKSCFSCQSINFNLAQHTQLPDTVFRKKFAMGEFILAVDGVKRYISDQVARERDIFKKDWRGRRIEVVDSDWYSGRIKGGAWSPGGIVFIKLAGLLNSTGQPAWIDIDGDLEVSKEFAGAPVVYIDSMCSNTPDKCIQKHEIDEILQWEYLRINVLNITSKKDMGAWIGAHIESPDVILEGTEYEGMNSRQIAELLHGYSYPVRKFYKSLKGETDFDYGMFQMYGYDGKDKYPNIAASHEPEKPVKKSRSRKSVKAGSARSVRGRAKAIGKNKEGTSQISSGYYSEDDHDRELKAWLVSRSPLLGGLGDAGLARLIKIGSGFNVLFGKAWQEIRSYGLTIDGIYKDSRVDSQSAEVRQCEGSRKCAVYLKAGEIWKSKSSSVIFEFPNFFSPITDIDNPKPGEIYSQKGLGIVNIWRCIDLKKFPPSRIIVDGSLSEFEHIRDVFKSGGLAVPVISIKEAKINPNAFYHTRPLSSLDDTLKIFALNSENERFLNEYLLRDLVKYDARGGSDKEYNQAISVLKDMDQFYGDQPQVRALDIRSDIKNTLDLLNKVIPGHKKQDECGYYTIKYNTSKIPRGSVAETLLKIYVNEILSLWLPGNDRVKLSPVSSARQSFLSVEYYNDKARRKRIGRSVVDFDGGIDGKVLRMVGVMNLALAASQIPDNLSHDEVKTKYVLLVNFIEKQFREISNVNFPESIWNNISEGIIIALPPTALIYLEKADEYYRYTIKQLQQFV